MPKNQLDRTIDNPYSRRTGGGAGVVVSGSTGGSSGVTDHGLLAGLADDDHTHYLNATRGDARYPLLATYNLHVSDPDAHHARATAGNGLQISGQQLGVLLPTDSGLTAGAGGLALGEPSSLGVGIHNAISGTTHTHTITHSPNPGAVAAILSSDAAGKTTLVTLEATTRLRSPLLDTASGSLSLAPAARILLDAGEWTELPAGKTIRSPSFSSGFAGDGLRIDHGVSDPGKITAELDNLYVRGRLHVYELLIHQIRATNGSLFVSNTGKAVAVSYVSGATWNLTTDPEHGFAVGDLIRAQRFTGTGVYQCNMQVTAVADVTHFTANYVSGTSPAVGMEFVRLGNVSDTTRQGGVYLTADDSGAPFVDVFTGVNSFAAWGSAAVRRVRFGQLSGITGANEYGFFTGSQTGGNLLATGAKTALRQGTTDVIVLDANGDSYFAGRMTIGPNGEIIQGTGSFGGGNFTGLRLWRDSGVGRIGAYNTNIPQWYGDTFGRLMAGAGKVWLDAGGLSLLTAGTAAFDYTYALNWYASMGGGRRAGIGAWTVGAATVLGLEVDGHTTTLDQSGRWNLTPSGGLPSFSSVAGGHTVVANRLGVGLAYDATPAAQLHVYGTTPVVRLASAASNQTIELNFYDGDATRKGRLLYAGGNAAGGKYFGFVNEASDGLWFLSDLTKWLSGSGTEWMRLDSTGLGIGGTPGGSEKLLVSGGSGITFSTLHSSHPNNGPVFRISSTATNGRVYGLRSSQGNDSILPSGTGAGNFQIIDYSANVVRWQMDSSGHIRQAGNLTLGGSSILTLEVNNTADTGGVIVLNSRDTHPAAPGVSTRVNMYMKGSFIVFEYSDTGDGVTRYFYHDMESAAGTWTQNTVGP